MAPLQSWLQKIENRTPPEKIELGLTHVIEVGNRLNILTPKATVITVAGTNGKGSTIATLEALLSKKNVSSYTSPHLWHYNERIKINQQCVGDDALCQAFEAIEQARDDIPLTYFEFGTLAALWCFQQQPLDYILLEVGLGGRLDAVNAVTPNFSVITNISLDHTDWLGDTLEKIAYEKAGIMRADTPVICGDRTPPNTIIQQAQKLGCPYYQLGQDFDYEQKNNHWTWQCAENSPKQCLTTEKIKERRTYTNLPRPQLLLENISTALMTYELLNNQKNDNEHIQQTLKTLSLAGRIQQQIIKGKEHIFDVGHNPAATKKLAHWLKKQPQKKTHIIIGMLQDKDIETTVRELIPYAQSWHCTELNTPRSVTETQWQKLMQQYKLNASIYKSPKIAYQSVMNQTPLDHRLIIIGSFHTVAAIEPTE